MNNDNDIGELADAREGDDVGDVDAARRNATKILSIERATPADIAWAWVTLLDIEAGNDITPGEGRYRKILFAQEEIDKLGLLKTDEAGFPVRKYKGVPVSGMGDRSADIGMVAVSSVRDAMLAAGAKWPSVDTGGGSAATPMGNDTGGKRHYLAHVFERAIKNIGGDTELAAVWNELKEMSLNGRAPLLVSDDKRKLKYTDANGDDAYYNYRALEKWLLRNTRKSK